MEKNEISWISIDDGYGIIGAGFECPNCEHMNMFCETDDLTVECEECESEFKNPGGGDF